MDQFLNEVQSGLSQFPKRLNPKYFYDEKGDKLFQQIMACDEYYPTDCELEIFKNRSSDLVEVLCSGSNQFDLIELGAGDATKSKFLLKALLDQGCDFTYMPIDISHHMIDYLEKSLPTELGDLKVKGWSGEYFEMLDAAANFSKRQKVVLFLGGNIGNFEPADALDFCKKLNSSLQPGDLVLMGFDLKKHPKVVLAAYNDKEGYTRAFNLNLLDRINGELGGNFKVDQFDHYPMYDPATGACKSYLISLGEQEVTVGNQIFKFAANEYIYMEISQKYSVKETDEMARKCGFIPTQHLFDQKEWFLDTIWSVS